MGNCFKNFSFIFCLFFSGISVYLQGPKRWFWFQITSGLKKKQWVRKDFQPSSNLCWNTIIVMICAAYFQKGSYISSLVLWFSIVAGLQQNQKKITWTFTLIKNIFCEEQAFNMMKKSACSVQKKAKIETPNSMQLGLKSRQ